MTKQLKCYYLLLIRYYKLSLLNQFLEGYSIMAAWGNNFLKKKFFLLFFHFSAPLKCHWPIRASSLKSHSPAGRIYSPFATGRVLMKRLRLGPCWNTAVTGIFNPCQTQSKDGIQFCNSDLSNVCIGRIRSFTGSKYRYFRKGKTSIIKRHIDLIIYLIDYFD